MVKKAVGENISFRKLGRVIDGPKIKPLMRPKPSVSHVFIRTHPWRDNTVGPLFLIRCQYKPVASVVFRSFDLPFEQITHGNSGEFRSSPDLNFGMLFNGLIHAGKVHELIISV